MLEAKLRQNGDSEEEWNNVNNEKQICFVFPPYKVMDQVWNSHEEITETLQRMAFKIGYFDSVLLFKLRKRVDVITAVVSGVMRCQYCNANLAISHPDAEGKYRILEVDNQHVHQANFHDPEFPLLYRYFLEAPLEECIDNLGALKLYQDKTQVVQIQNIYYQQYMDFDKIIDKIGRQQDCDIRVWKDPSLDPIMTLIVSKNMKKNYRMYGDAVNFQALPRISQIARTRYIDQYWIIYSFIGVDSNSNLTMFGVLQIKYSSQLLYKKEQLIYQGIATFFLLMEHQYPQSFITSDASHVLRAVRRIMQHEKANFAHLVAWPYKLKNLKTQMRKKQYSKKEVHDLLSLYLQLLKQKNQDSFIETALHIYNLSWEKDTLLKFLENSHHYCPLGFPNCYMGYNFNLQKNDVFQVMATTFARKFNLYNHLTNILKFDEYLTKNSIKTRMAYRSTYQNADTRINRIIDCFKERQLQLFQTKLQSNKRYCIEKTTFSRLFASLLQIDNFRVDKIRNGVYGARYKKESRHKWYIVLLRNSVDSTIKRWKCSCMFKKKAGIPCPHLVLVLESEKVQFCHYIGHRWVRQFKNVDITHIGEVLTTKKRRRHP